MFGRVKKRKIMFLNIENLWKLIFIIFRWKIINLKNNVCFYKFLTSTYCSIGITLLYAVDQSSDAMDLVKTFLKLFFSVLKWNKTFCLILKYEPRFPINLASFQRLGFFSFSLLLFTLFHFFLLSFLIFFFFHFFSPLPLTPIFPYALR